MDGLGLILAVVVHAADIQDRDGAKLVLGPLRRRFSRLRVVVADSIDNGGIAEWVRSLRARNRLRLEVVSKRAGATTFEVIPFRWRVERTFAWLGRWRRHSKDYEGTTSSSEAFVKLAMIHLMARRLAKKLGRRLLSPHAVSGLRAVPRSCPRSLLLLTPRGVGGQECLQAVLAPIPQDSVAASAIPANYSLADPVLPTIAARDRGWDTLVN